MSLDLEYYKRRAAQEHALADQGGLSAAIHRQLEACYQAKIDAIDAATDAKCRGSRPVHAVSRGQTAFLKIVPPTTSASA